MNARKAIWWTVTSIIVTALNIWAWWVLKAPFDLHSKTTWWEAIIWIACIGIAGLIVSYIDEEVSVFSRNENPYLWPSIVTILAVVLWVAYLIARLFSSNALNAQSRYEMVADAVQVIEDGDGVSAFPNLLGSNNDTSNLPLLGTPEAIKNAETLMGSQPALGSQYELLEEEVTSQNIGNSLMYVVPLEPKSWIKWDGNNHGYFIIDRNNGTTTFVEEGLVTTEKAPFGDNAIRVIYDYMSHNHISGRITELSPEVDDDGNFKYVATVYETSGVDGMHTVTGVVELDATDKTCQYYSLDEVPPYIDRVFPETIFQEYIKYYGEYKNGWLNSFIGQKEVLVPTNGSDIVYIDGTCWYYTGFTSAGKGESSNGIIMMNCRTGEIKYFITYGISEEKAMGIAEGRVQEKGYKASYPLLLMVGGQETYFMLMRDANNNICAYAFVSYKDYTKAAVAESLSTAQTQYIKATGTSNSADILDDLALSKGRAVITAIGSEVKEGSTLWYIMLDGNEHIFTLTSAMEPNIVFAETGDMAEISYIEEVSIDIN